MQALPVDDESRHEQHHGNGQEDRHRPRPPPPTDHRAGHHDQAQENPQFQSHGAVLPRRAIGRAEPWTDSGAADFAPDEPTRKKIPDRIVQSQIRRSSASVPTIGENATA